jgi:peptidoglycan/LPS O-acetylase OafA/YrhL
LGIPGFAKGFLGVDIFFVISGYLITQILLRDLAGGKFSLIGFYRRRVVRILPALLVMLVLVSAAGALILFPAETRSMAMSTAAAAAFASNFHFWSSVNYFEHAELRPMLHTWSLGVEEQFYLVYPLLLLALWRWARTRLALSLWIVTLASLALSWLLGIDHPTAAFYMLPSRGWELGIGAVAAAGGFPEIRAAGTRALLSVGALLVMLAAALTLPRVSLTPGVFPAPAAIPVCAAAAILLAYGDSGAASKLLSLAPLRWTGRISYSLYLWHFPLITLYRAEFGPSPGRVALVPLAILSVVLGVLSWRFIETPFRQRFRHAGHPRAIVAGGVAACAIVALGGVGLALAAPYVRRLPPEVARITAYSGYRGSSEFNYQFGPVECYGATRRYDAARCLVPDPARRNILVLGDSYAAHLWRAVAERFPGDKVMLAASGGCRPLVGAGGLRLCREMVARVMREEVAAHRVQAVVLAAHWAPKELRLLAPTIRAIEAQGVAVTVVGPVVGYRVAAPRAVAMAVLHHDPASADRQRLNPAQLDSQMRALAESAGAHYYSLYDQECPGGQCRLLTRTGAPFHFDDAHLTLAGARELAGGMPRP